MRTSISRSASKKSTFAVCCIASLSTLNLLYPHVSSADEQVVLDDGRLGDTLRHNSSSPFVSEEILGIGTIGACVLNYTSTESVVEDFLADIGRSKDVDLKTFFFDEQKWSVVRVAREGIQQIIVDDRCLRLDSSLIGLCERVGGRAIKVNRGEAGLHVNRCGMNYATIGQ